MGISPTGRRELNGFEKCLLPCITMVGEVTSNIVEVEQTIPFGPFQLQGQFQENGLEFQLSGKNWTSRKLRFYWTTYEYNHIPIVAILTRQEAIGVFGNGAYFTEYKDLRLLAGSLPFSKSLMWDNSKFILYGRGSRCFSPEDFSQWELKATLSKGSAKQEIWGGGKILFDRNCYQQTKCDPTLVN